MQGARAMESAKLTTEMVGPLQPEPEQETQRRGRALSPREGGALSPREGGGHSSPVVAISEQEKLYFTRYC